MLPISSVYVCARARATCAFKKSHINAVYVFLACIIRSPLFVRSLLVAAYSFLQFIALGFRFMNTWLSVGSFLGYLWFLAFTDSSQVSLHLFAGTCMSVFQDICLEEFLEMAHSCLAFTDNWVALPVSCTNVVSYQQWMRVPAFWCLCQCSECRGILF